ncbi:MAG TPA: SdrD B-like domain-containing protein, partial [Caulifigura sp.]|nr:SdrD B-like domain-containing protein [Caulifigura sp.]
MLSLKRRFRRRLAARMRQFFGAARLSRRRVVRGSTPAIESLEVRWMLSSTTADIDETPLADQPRAFIGPDVSLVTQGSTASHPGTCCCAGCMALLPSAQMALGSMPSGGDLPPSGNAPFPLANTFLLNSRPSASRTIYLDFNGNTATGTSWNKTYGSSIVTPAYSFEGDSSFSDAELERIQYIWQRVVEDFAPFDVNITTQDPGSAGLTKSNSSDTTWGVRVCIGGSYSDWYGPACGGVSMIGTFASSSESPNFVFANNLYNDEKYVAEAISHEVGHSLGLSHDGQTPSTTYYAGHGSGATGWAPIMGSGYYQEVTQWSKGEYSGANNTQDDLAIITGANNFGYRVDDYGSSLGTASTLAVVNGTGVKLVNQAGVIERNTDTDWFKFSSSGGNVSLTFSPWVRGANLDISASLYNSSGQLVATSNPADALGASITVTVGAGDYYVMLDGVGVRGVTDGYSDYGSIGQYTITGTIEDNVAASNASVAGRIWHDRNGNSAIDSGEEGLAGVVVYIDANNNGVFDSATELSRTTAADGSYMFSALAAGDYRIREVYTSGWLAVGASSQLVTLAAGQSATSINFGNALPASVAGRTWHDRNANGIADSGEEGLGGVLVYIDANNNGVFDSGSETSITTATDGTYSINGLMPGSERIRTVPVAGWAVVGDSSKLLTLTSGLASSANDFALDNTNYYSVGDISDIDSAVNSVNENAANGTSVGIRANAVDQDTTNNVVTYSLSADAGGRFAIDPVTGIVTVARGDWLDREAAAAWSITVVATSQDGSSKVKAFTISLNDVNEFVVGAVSDTNADLNSVDENAPNGTTVGITA